MDIAKRLRPIDINEVAEDYKKLQDFSCRTQTFSRVGLKVLDKFFLHKRLATKTKHHISFLNAMKNQKTWKYVKAKTRKIKQITQKNKADPNRLLRKEYDVFQLYYGTINQFRPAVAKWLYCKLGATSILDFSAGWGGRCLAAMSLGIPYIGIDSNKTLAPSYKKLINVDPKADVTMIFKPSETVDFTKYSYDLVFTSPPYFMLEEYARMPEYGSKEGFIEKFFLPVCKKAWASLKQGGHMALNMPEEMFKAIKDAIPVKVQKISMKLQDRHATLSLTGSASSEYIYVWRKV
jgi:hypothetical protein